LRVRGTLVELPVGLWVYTGIQIEDAKDNIATPAGVCLIFHEIIVVQGEILVSS
jgi:hypothetical protein